jgi:hypothetical protein
MSRVIRKYFRVRRDGQDGRGDPRGLAVAQVNENGSVSIGFALCSEVDSFNRGRANQIALGRLNSRKFTYDPANIDSIPNVIDPAFTPMAYDITWAAKAAVERAKRSATV